MVAAHVVVLFVLVISPAMIGLAYLALKRNPTSASKMRMYSVTMILMWTAAIACSLVLPPEQVLSFKEPLPIPAVVHILFAGSLLFLLVTLIVPVGLVWRRHREFLEQVRESFVDKKHVFPLLPKERRMFVGVAISVGVGEEIIFRAFLVRYLEQLPFDWGWWTCFAIAALLFGLAHFNQGVGGMLNTFILAICFSYLFVVTGSLWPAVILHIVYDLKIVFISRHVQIDSSMQTSDA